MKTLLKRFMYTLLVVVIWVLILANVQLKDPPLNGVSGDFVIQNVNVIDVLNGKVIKNRNVYLSNDVIVKMDSLKSANEKFHAIDGTDKYLIPGYWDMHTHSTKLSPQLHHAQFFVNGVTSVRDMSGCLSEDDSFWACVQDRNQWNEEVSLGQRISPRYLIQSSYQTNGGNEVPEDFPGFFNLNTERDAQKMIEFNKKSGVDFIKTYSELTPSQLQWLYEYAMSSGLKLAGHKPIKVSLEKALSMKMSSLEHGRLFLFECYKDIEALKDLESPIQAYDANLIRKMMNNTDDEKCSELMSLMSQSETHWTPTLTTLKMSAMAFDDNFYNDSRLQHIPYIVRKLIWAPDIQRARDKGWDYNGEFVHKDHFLWASKRIQEASEKGVKILVGTDNIDSYVYTGSSLHDELEMLVNTGLTNHTALKSATIDAAKFMHEDANYGSVEVGKKADLILLEHNPLEDIKHSDSICAIFFAGKYYDQKSIIALKSYSRDMTQSLSVNIQLLFSIFKSPLMRVQFAD